MANAKEFYIEWLGFKIEFEHQFEENTPYYIGITKDDIQLHLSEHYYHVRDQFLPLPGSYYSA